MSFVFPLFLMGLGMLVVPWWLHRLKVQNAQRESFSSLQFMQAASERVFTQKQLRYRWLLALRCALLAVLAVAFAQPVLTHREEVTSSAVPHWLVVDLSASMERALDALPASVDQVLQTVPNDAAVGLLTLGQELREVVPAGTPRGQLVSAIGQLTTDYSRSSFDQIIAELTRFLIDERSRPRPAVVHLISDFQASAMPEQFARMLAPAHIRLVLHPVVDLSQDNWSVRSVTASDGFMRIVVGQSGSPGAITARINLNGQQVDGAIPVEPAIESGHLLSIPVELLPGENRVIVTLSGDGLTGDDVYYAVLSRGGSIKVPLLTVGTDDPAAVYLSTALAAVGGEQVFAPQPVADFDSRVLSRHSWLAITDLAAVPAALAPALRQWVQGGGRLLAGLGPTARSLEVVPVTGHRLDWPLEMAAALPLKINTLQRGHPYLGDTPGWHDVSVQRVAPVVLLGNEDILIGVDGGQALLLTQSLGAGQVALLNSDLARRWNDLPASAVFVPWVAAMAQAFSGHAALARQRHVGEAIDLRRVGGSVRQLVAPSGGALFGLDAKGPVGLSEPGFYELYDDTANTVTLAANMDARESDLRILAEATLQQWRDTLAAVTPVASPRSSRTPETRPLTLPFLLLLCVVLVAESLLANHHLRASPA